MKRTKIKNDLTFYQDAIKSGCITKHQQGQILNWLDKFYNETKSGKIIHTQNGFVAVGKLVKKQYHDPAQPPVNDILMVQTMSTEKFKSINCYFVYMTKNETLELYKCLKSVLKI